MVSQSGLLDKAFQSLDKIERQLPEQALRILAQTQNLVIELNTKEQLQKGIDSKGNKITPKYRNQKYSRAKNSRNPLPGLGTPDLNLTGSFQNNFYVIKEQKGFRLFSSDKKASMLEDKYGSIFGLTPDNEGKYNLEIILPRLIEWMLQNIKI